MTKIIISSKYFQEAYIKTFKTFGLLSNLNKTQRDRTKPIREELGGILRPHHLNGSHTPIKELLENYNVVLVEESEKLKIVALDDEVDISALNAAQKYLSSPQNSQAFKAWVKGFKTAYSSLQDAVKSHQQKGTLVSNSETVQNVFNILIATAGNDGTIDKILREEASDDYLGRISEITREGQPHQDAAEPSKAPKQPNKCQEQATPTQEGGTPISVWIGAGLGAAAAGALAYLYHATLLAACGVAVSTMAVVTLVAVMATAGAIGMGFAANYMCNSHSPTLGKVASM